MLGERVAGTIVAMRSSRLVGYISFSALVACGCAGGTINISSTTSTDMSAVVGEPRDMAISNVKWDLPPTPMYPGSTCLAPTNKLRPGDGHQITADPKYTMQLTGSGGNTAPLAPFDSQDPAEPNLTPEFAVAAPNAQCPRLLNRFQPFVAIPRSSKIRAYEAFFNGTRLPLLPVFNGPDERLVDEAHSYGPQMLPFNAPLFSLEGIPPGKGTLEIRAYDATLHEVTVAVLENIEVMATPEPAPTARFAGSAHPRLWLTPERLANARAKVAANDHQAQNYKAALKRFLDQYEVNPDPNSAAFNDRVYLPSAYMWALGLCYQLNKQSDPTTAMKCADAGRLMAVKIANDYNGADQATKFSRDTGYDIRLGHMRLVAAYDWLYDRFSPEERTLIANVLTAWCDWYGGSPGGYSQSRPWNNYFPPYIQALAATAIITAGEVNNSSDRLLGVLRSKMGNIMTVNNQRVCGGDWPEGGNYGPDSIISSLLTYAALKDYGEDWAAVYDWVQPQAQLYRYQVVPDGTLMLPFGGFSGNRSHMTSPILLAMLSTLTSTGPHATALYNKLAPNPNNDFGTPFGDAALEAIFGDLKQAGPMGDEPLSCYASGSGRFLSKSSLSDDNAYHVAGEIMHYQFDHFGYANGDLRFYHGGTCILCPRAYRGPAFRGEESTPGFSTYSANGKRQAECRNNQTLFVQEEGTFSAIGMRFESAFVNDRFDENFFEDAAPLDYLIREAVHVRPDVLVIRDLHRRRHQSDTLLTNLHLGAMNDPVKVSDTQYTIGKISVSMSTSQPVTIAFSDDTDEAGTRLGKNMTMTFAGSTEAIEVITVVSDNGTTLSAYGGGVAKLSNGKCVKFENGRVAVGGGC